MASRYADLREALSPDTPSFPVVLGVPEPEFEARLLSDIEALRACSDREVPRGLPAPETLEPRRAKSRFGTWEHAADDPTEARADLCRHLDLARVASACPSFDRFLRDLSAR